MFFKSKKAEKKEATTGRLPVDARQSGIVEQFGSRSGTNPATAQATSPTPPPCAAPLSPDLLDVDFASPPAAIANCLFDVKNGELTLGAGQFWKSGPTIAAHQGEIFEIETRARLVRPPSNGLTNGFYVGALIYDANGEVLTWWETVPQVVASEGFRQVIVRVVAPAGAVSVGIGICGTWSPDNRPADFIVSFRKVALKRVTA